MQYLPVTVVASKDMCRVKKDVVCHSGKSSHLQRACRSKGKSNQGKYGQDTTKTVRQVDGEGEKGSEESLTLCHLQSGGVNVPPIMVKVKLDDCLVNKEVDTGASFPLMSGDLQRVVA